LPADTILGLEALNIKLAAINRLFLEETGLDRVRIEMREIPNLDPGVLESSSKARE